MLIRKDAVSFSISEACCKRCLQLGIVLIMVVLFALDAETDASPEPITTGRAPVGYDADSGNVATIEDPGRGNTKTAAGKTTLAGNQKAALPCVLCLQALAVA